MRSAVGADTTVMSGAAPMRGLSKNRSIRGGRYQVSANYFETLRTPFIAGGAFTDTEVRARAHVAILSESAVRIFFADVPPMQVVGRSVTIDDEPARVVVGIVPDMKGEGYGRDADTALFLPIGSQPSRYGIALVRMQDGAAPQRAMVQERLSQVLGAGHREHQTSVCGAGTRSAGPTVQGHALRRALNCGAPTRRDRPLRDRQLRRRATSLRNGGTMSLGARARDIQRLVIWDATRPVLVGIALGLAGASWAEKFLATFLFGIEPRDPLAYSVVIAVLLTTAILAAWLPARRAVRVDPATMLRAQ